jgi:hypothetical protein
MADEKKPIDLVTTFVAEPTGLSLEESLKKFQGRRTLRTVAAARRITAKKRKVKIPRNLLRQLFRLTGGWKPDQIQANTEVPSEKNLRLVVVGDLEAIFELEDRLYYGPTVWLRYRGRLVAKIKNGQYDQPWLDAKKAVGAAVSLGVPYTPSK